MQRDIIGNIQESIDVKKLLLEDQNSIQKILRAAQVCINAYKNNKKLLIAGNGGSAADAQHFAGELVSRFYFDRDALPALALTTDTSILTAIGNDYGYENIFSRQIQGIGVEGDVLIAISTSGNSPNILNALDQCRKKGIESIGLTGKNSSKMDDLCNICIKVPSTITPRIQEAHIMIEHILCSIIEKSLFMVNI